MLIPNWNSKKYIAECIESIVNQTYSNFEIILIDNASTDNSVELVRERYPFVRIIQNITNLGFAGAVNIGIENASGKLVAILNQDAYADKDWLNHLVSVVCESDTIGAAAGKAYYWRDERQREDVFCTWSKVDPYTANVYNFSDNEPTSKVDYVTGAGMMVNKDVIRKVGYLDTEYFLYFDETDWCARMIRARYDLVYVPDAIIWHVVSSSISNPELKQYFMTRNRIRFALKNFDVRYIPGFMLFFAVETARLLFRRRVRLGLTETKIRLTAVWWNVLNLPNTLRARRRDIGLISRALGKIEPYNESLPLKEYKIGMVERFLSKL